VSSAGGLPKEQSTLNGLDCEISISSQSVESPAMNWFGGSGAPGRRQGNQQQESRSRNGKRPDQSQT
jgi:hypothetical protein